MKKLLLLMLALSGLVLKSVAQPTLSAAHSTPNGRGAFLNQYTHTAGVSDGSAGANQTWDYSTLTDSNATTGYLVVTPASTPYASSFPQSNLAFRAGNDSAYLYLDAQTAELSELGGVIPAVGTVKYTKPKVYLPYPFTYQGFFTDSVVEQSTAFNITLRGKDSLKADGYGTLKIPGKTYSNVLRVKYIENITGTRDLDTTFAGLPVTVTVVANIRTISYLYYTPDTHAPLLSNEFSQTHITGTVGGIIPVIDSFQTSKDISYLKNSILPVTFTSFKAALNDKEVSLQWGTGQEINTDHFSVQRSLTNTNFSDITDVEASGKSSGASYTYSDQAFIKTDVPPTVYYRIKETDKDGKEFYSTIAILHGTASFVNVYPNPAKNYINLNVKDITTADAITIYDAKGHMVQQLHNYQVNRPVNVSNLSKGTYFIQVKIKDKTTTTSLVKE